ncbi:uncharacterized protein LOC131152168 isoform X2 [Malania oleifera]|uniref:uncharacterized protein LOC131152168 isoform X2 n=1 Tax=Malania oleifera TaxID=397392 RepID=UPI0025AE42D0|nr:uncharacterized protein LOC131152168 isoform X2 [Malania oleifera]
MEELNSVEVSSSLHLTGTDISSISLPLSLSLAAKMAKVAWFLLLASLLFVSTSADIRIKVTNNPADKLVVVLNDNRTAHKLSALRDNPGLGCIALQYIKAYQGHCDQVGGSNAKKPADSLFAETFAPNCGVQVSTLSTITGRLLGCQSDYVHPPKAFSDVLMLNNKSLEILYSKNHTEVGAAVTGTDGGSPYFWCVLFSGGKPNSSFVLEGGVAKITRPGCFSGANDECSGAEDPFRDRRLWSYAISGLIALNYAFGL